MKYELKNAENSILKTFVALLAYFFILIFSMYIFTSNNHNEMETFNKILNFINYPNFKEYILTDKLLYLFSNLYFVLYFSLFYIYEHVYFHNSLATRYPL